MMRARVAVGEKGHLSQRDRTGKTGAVRARSVTGNIDAALSRHDQGGGGGGCSVEHALVLSPSLNSTM